MSSSSTSDINILFPLWRFTMMGAPQIIALIQQHLETGCELSLAIRKSVAPDHAYAPETVQLWHAIVWAEHLTAQLKTAPKASTR